MVASLDRMALYTALEPVIKAALEYGSIDSLLERSKSIAIVELLNLMATATKEDVRLRAVDSVLNRAIGKPVERKIDLYANLADVDPKDLDRRIAELAKKVGAKELIEGAVSNKEVIDLLKTKADEPAL